MGDAIDTHEPIDIAREREFRLGALRVVPSLCRVATPDGADLRLEPRVMQVLTLLARTSGAIVTREALRECCWGGRVVSDDAVERVVARLRRLAAERRGEDFAVETVPKVGYRLVARQGLEKAEPCEAPDAVDGPASGPPRFSRRTLVGGVAAGAAAAAAGLLAIRTRGGVAPRRAGPLRLAVLPFTADGHAPVLADFARQLSDEVRADLSRVTDIRIIAETSSRSAAGEGGSARDVARRVGADLLVEGQVGETGGRRSATAALIDGVQGTELWSLAVSALKTDPGTLRVEVSGAIISQLASIVPVSPTRAPPAKRPDPQVYELVSEANRLLEDLRTQSMRGRRDDALAIGDKASALANQALAIDPNDGGALTALATITRNGWTHAMAREPLTTEQRVERSIAIVRRALAADPRNAAALTQLGDYDRRFAFRWGEAETLFSRALAIDPSLVDAHWSYAYELGTIGRGVEGLGHALTVFELDLRNPFRRIALPRLLYILGQRRAAMWRYEAELAAQPNNLFLLRELYFMFLSEGNAVDLAGLKRRVVRIAPENSDAAALIARIDAGVLALSGSPSRLKALVDADVAAYDGPAAAANATPQGRARDDLPYIFAIEYAWAGAPERALAMLDRALSAKSLYWPATLPFGNAPFPRAVQGDPRFAALWQRDPGLSELVRRRRAAVLSGQMAGVRPDGRKVIPVLPPSLVFRVRAALSGR